MTPTVGRKTTSLVTRGASPRSLFEEFDRVFDDLRTGLEGVFWMPSVSPLAPVGANGTRPAAVDLKDAGQEFVLTAELPGVPKDAVDVNVTEDGVEIRAQVDEEKERRDDGYSVRERSYGSWYRRLPFPVKVLPEKAEAGMKDGVLTLRVAKKEATTATKAKKVPVE